MAAVILGEPRGISAEDISMIIVDREPTPVEEAMPALLPLVAPDIEVFYL